jgi:hypothetical protein
MLNKRVVIYVPGKTGDELQPEAQARWKRRALERFSELFGGATAQVAEGAWMGDGGLVIEPVVIVYSYTDADGEVRHRGAVMDLAREMAADMRQECVSVEMGGGMEFIAEAA